MNLNEENKKFLWLRNRWILLSFVHNRKTLFWMVFLSPLGGQVTNLNTVISRVYYPFKSHWIVSMLFSSVSGEEKAYKCKFRSGIRYFERGSSSSPSHCVGAIPFALLRPTTACQSKAPPFDVLSLPYNSLLWESSTSTEESLKAYTVLNNFNSIQRFEFWVLKLYAVELGI